MLTEMHDYIAVTRFREFVWNVFALSINKEAIHIVYSSLSHHVDTDNYARWALSFYERKCHTLYSGILSANTPSSGKLRMHPQLLNSTSESWSKIQKRVATNMIRSALVNDSKHQNLMMLFFYLQKRRKTTFLENKIWAIWPLVFNDMHRITQLRWSVSYSEQFILLCLSQDRLWSNQSLL